jgi:hypothetical protein
MSDQSTTVERPSQEPKTFGFDHSYWSHDDYQADASGCLVPAADAYADQERIFTDLGQPMVNSSLQGFNGKPLVMAIDRNSIDCCQPLGFLNMHVVDDVVVAVAMHCLVSYHYNHFD